MSGAEEGKDPSKYRSLDPDKIVDTIARLRNRIRERFPGAGLLQVANSLLSVAQDHARRSVAIRRPIIPLRAASCLLLAAIAAALIGGVITVSPHLESDWRWMDVVQTLEAALGALFFLSTGVLLLATLEARMKRHRCLSAIHEMRAMAHIVDMHQLTKDPERARLRRDNTPASPENTLSHFQLARYLDYCSEMLSLIGKISALYVQGVSDPAASSAVDEVETLTTALSGKIWQKIMILDRRLTRPEDQAIAERGS